MKRKNLVCKSFAIGSDGKLFALRYFLLRNSADTPKYGVSIEKCKVKVCERESFSDITNSYDDMYSFIRTLAKNYVTPCTLPDVIDDWNNSLNELERPVTA